MRPFLSHGNREALTETTNFTATSVNTYTYDAANRLTSLDGVTYTWDARGNLTNDGVFTYTYDGAGRTVRAASVTETRVYTYDGDGLRVAQRISDTETTFVWDRAAALPQELVTAGDEVQRWHSTRVPSIQSACEPCQKTITRYNTGSFMKSIWRMSYDYRYSRSNDPSRV
jgi:YD repeat-containing protein